MLFFVFPTYAIFFQLQMLEKESQARSAKTENMPQLMQALV